jgi:hypothetical protein
MNCSLSCSSSFILFYSGISRASSSSCSPLPSVGWQRSSIYSMSYPAHENKCNLTDSGHLTWNTLRVLWLSPFFFFIDRLIDFFPFFAYCMKGKVWAHVCTIVFDIAHLDNRAQNESQKHTLYYPSLLK